MAEIARSIDLSIVGANGGGWVTDLGVAAPAAPTSYTGTPPPSLMPLGAISQDGLTWGLDEERQDFFDFNGLSPIWRQITQSVRTFEVTLWETNRPVCKSVMFRKPVSAVTATANAFSFAEYVDTGPDRRSWIFDVVDGLSVLRFFVPHGEVTGRADVAFNNNQVAGYGLRVTAHADAAGMAVYHLGHSYMPAEWPATHLFPSTHLFPGVD